MGCILGPFHADLNRRLLANDMKLLVAIASYGRKNDAYLERVLSEYRSMSYETDILVLCNLDKDCGKDIQVVTGTPTRNPHSLPFGHKQVFAARKDAYDLFVYTEDDILITQRNLEAFLQASSILPPGDLAGFFRWEQYPDGRRFYPDAHFFYRWVPGSVQVAGNHTFARFTNDHSGCFALTRGQLRQAIESGRFLVPPHEHRYSLLETAATGPYTECGFRKLICLSNFDDFLVQHLPNRYIGTPLGLDGSEFSRQVEALLHPRHVLYAAVSLLEPETKTFHCRWSKNYYEPCRADLIGMFPAGTRSVLSIGCGWGETEAELARKGIGVTAIPLDSVIASCAESRGVEVVYGDLDGAVEQLRGRRFDGVLMTGILHLLDDPAKAVAHASSLLAEGGVLVATIPAFHRLPILWERLNHPSRYRGLRDFQRSGIHPISRRLAKAWFRNAGLSVDRISSIIPQRWRNVAGLSHRLANAFLASEYALVGRRAEAARKTPPFSIVGRQGETERDMTPIDRNAGE